MKVDLAQKRHAACEVRPELGVMTLKPSHPAMKNKTTIFPTRVFAADEVPRILISGVNSRKTGKLVTKGPWAGMPIYTLTLEERATCPASCHMASTCYGNGMQWARRVRHGTKFERLLIDEVQALAFKHRKGFVVRLHVLGDFYSAHYVMVWTEMLARLPQLHVYGYTARSLTGSKDDRAIAKAITAMNLRFADRCFIRFSGVVPAPMGACVIDHKPMGSRVQEGIVCPAELDKTSCCGNCGLCWSPAMLDETIVFIKHGNTSRGRPRKVAG